MPPQNESLLARLVGEELGSIIFVRDYLQLDFDGPRLNCYVWPALVSDSRELRMGEAGYRDALCELIGAAVTGYLDKSDSGLVLHLGHNSLVIEPPDEELLGFELAELHLWTGSSGPAPWRMWVTDDGLSKERRKRLQSMGRPSAKNSSFSP